MLEKIKTYIRLKRQLHDLLKAYKALEPYTNSKTDYATLCIYAKGYNDIKQKLNNLWN